MFGIGNNFYMDSILMANEANMLSSMSYPPCYIPGVSDIRHARISGNLLTDKVTIVSQKDRDRKILEKAGVGAVIIATGALFADKIKGLFKAIKPAITKAP